MSRYHDEEENQKLWLDNIVLTGDPLLVDNKIAVINVIKKSNKKVKTLSGDELQEDNITLVVQPIELVVHGEMYVWTGKLNGSPQKVSGSKCNMIQPTLVVVDGKSCGPETHTTWNT